MGEAIQDRMPVCSICGNDSFQPAPFNRLSRNGMPPVCTKCRSLERHRIFREIFNRIRTPDFRNQLCLQFSNDPSTAGGWFRDRETSMYGGDNSLDLQAVDRPDAAYDVVVCNHVLEHVPDYRAGIRELVRITKPTGFVFLSFPNPYIRAVTEDWGYPRPDQHMHYRLFGRDVEAVFGEEIPHANVIAVEAMDPVTEQRDMAYILTGSDEILARVRQRVPKARTVQERRPRPESSAAASPAPPAPPAPPAQRTPGADAREKRGPITDPRITVAILGTFDVRNYGDLLFPLLAARRLGEWGIDVAAFSPVGGATGWADTAPCRSMTDLAAGLDRLGGLVIGGGNIVHLGAAHLIDYPREMEDWAYPSLWLGATALAAIAHRPVVWNAPGVPQAFDRKELDGLVLPAIAASEYVSVRDAASRDMLDPDGRHAVRVVPDTAAEIARLWSREELASDFAALIERKGQPLGGRGHFVVHAKLRSLPEEGAAPVAALIDAHAERTGLVPLLVAIGQCHDDQVVARRVANRMHRPCILLDDPLGLREIAAAIAHAEQYVGCSLHGYVSAAAYGRAARIVARPNLPKQAGFLDHIGRPGDLAPDWEAAFAAIAADRAAASIPADVLAQLDDHWTTMAQVIRKPRKGLYEDRTRFLRAAVARGIAGRGWTWLRPAIT